MRRNKKLAKVLTGTLATAMLVSGTVPAYAATGTSGATSTLSVETGEAVEGTNAVNVYAKIGSSYTVTIPKTITLDGSTKTGSYTVSVAGDIAGDETVNVVPDASFKMSQTDKADVTASITQDKTAWKVAEFGTAGNGSISASGLTAGAWNGTFNFNVGLEKAEAYGEDVTLTSDNLSTYGIAKTGDVVIPSTVTDSDGVKHKVTSIGDLAFNGCKGLTTVTIPESVTSIGSQAFNDCNLSSIIVDSNNPIYDSRNDCNAIIETSTNTLIQGCKNTIIPNSVTSIGDFAFNSCSGLTSVTIPDSVTSIGRRAFRSCTGLTSITIPDNVTYIGDSAFRSCSGLTSVTIPDSVTSIGNEAFHSCSGLTSIKLSNSVTSIGDFAFEECDRLSTIIYKGQNYTSKSELSNVLESNGVSMDPFSGTSLTK